MDNNKCEAMMDIFFKLDKHGHIPIKLTLHLFTCKKCRSKVRMLSLIERNCANEINDNFSTENQTVQSIMNKIDSSYGLKEKARPVTMKRWIFSGIAMVIALCVFTIFKTSEYSHSLTVWFYLFFACAVTTYCAMFIGSNIDFFVKQIDKFPIKESKKGLI